MKQIFDENGMLKTSFERISITASTSGDRTGAKTVKEYLSKLNIGDSISQIDLISRLHSVCTRAVVVGCVRFLEEKKMIKIVKGRNRNSPITITILRKVEVE